jgi:pyruvate dehydrogenase E2 component (dihydrolipoamide acetyltransferase)
MARWEFKLPDIGEGVAEGEIVTWLVKPGDVVREDQPMVEVMTDKATVTIGAPRAGVIAETRGRVGEVVAVHSVLVVFDALDHAGGETPGRAVTDGGAQASAPKGGYGATNGTVSRGEEGPAATAVGDIRESLPGMATQRTATKSTTVATASPSQGYWNDKPLATPATRQMARELSIDLKRVPPSGPQGRVTKQDLVAFSQGAATPAVKPASGAMTRTESREPVRIAPVTGGRAGGGPREERVPFAGLRRKIAARMAQSKHTAAHFTFVEECDATALKGMRSRMKGHAEALGVKLTFLPFIVKACVAALKKHPILNSALDEVTQEIVYRRYYNIGIATSTDAGLIVPVVKEADEKSFLDLAREIDRLSVDAKAGKSRAEDLAGSTFTITSLGAQGGLLATPILNFPEVGILGVHRIKERPVVKNGQIVIGDVMLLSLSFDHRIVDGHVGAAFAYELIAYLEEPDKLLLEMA